jgi:hypothetical protein
MILYCRAEVIFFLFQAHSQLDHEANIGTKYHTTIIHFQICRQAIF